VSTPKKRVPVTINVGDKLKDQYIGELVLPADHSKSQAVQGMCDLLEEFAHEMRVMDQFLQPGKEG
jgi:hypothetical protein